MYHDKLSPICLKCIFTLCTTIISWCSSYQFVSCPYYIPFITDTVNMPTKRQSSSGKGLFSTLKSRFRRNRTGSVDSGDPCDRDNAPDIPVRSKCATLPARVSEGKAFLNEPKTLHWMVGDIRVMDEIEGLLVTSPTVSREDSKESVDSGFHGFHLGQKIDEQDPKLKVVPSRSVGEGKIYDVATVEKAFGPLKDVGRWYSTYSNSRQSTIDESRYVHRPLRLQQSLDEEERLTSRPLPPIPRTPDSYQAPPVPPHMQDNPTTPEPNQVTPAVKSNSPPVPPHMVHDDTVYEHVEKRMLGTNGLCLDLRDLSQHGWYWGPIARVEAEERLGKSSDGTFLVRDSSDDRYLLSLSFRSQGKTLHTRIEHSNGFFSFYSYPDSDSEGFHSVVELIERSMAHSQEGVFCFSRARALGSPAVPVRLLKPFSRFSHVRSLQHYCRFAIRQSIRFDLIRTLPLPRHVHGFLEQSQF